MQKFIFKYGLAVHLAILAAAPLFLFPMADPQVGNVVLLWLSLSAISWVFMEPSLRTGEFLHNARMRVVSDVVRDPLSWVLVAFVVVAGLCAVNGGVSLVYDAEKTQWQISEAMFPVLPSSVGDSGMLLFSSAVALFVLTIGVRHALGRSARMAFLSIAASLAGLAALLLLFAVSGGWAMAASFPWAEAHYSFVGFVFGVYLIGGTVALVSAVENGWYFLMMLCIFSIGGTAVGLFCFSPAYQIAAVGLVELVVLLYSLVFACRIFQATFQLKVLAVVAMSLTVATMFVLGMYPPALMKPKVDAFMNLALFADGFWEVRDVLSAVAFKTWSANLWLGGGIDSFSLDFRFFAQAADWQLLPRGAQAVPNGWWMVLAERGLLGFVVLVLPLYFLLAFYVRRLVGWFRVLDLPHPASVVAPLVLALVVALGFFDCSFFRADALMAAFPVLAASAASFSTLTRRNHGR